MATISGSRGQQVFASGQSISPFATVSIGDSIPGAQEAITITVLNSSGTATDADGTLSGTGLTEIAPGTYQLTPGTTTDVTTALDALVFTPTDGTLYDAVNTTFTISDVSSSGGVSQPPVTDSGTAVVVTTVLGLPTIAGVPATESTTDNTPIRALGALNISDPNTGGTESVTVNLVGTNGLATDANGTLSGTSLIKVGVGSYVVSGTAQAVSQALDAAVFTPTSVAAGQTSTTTLTITDLFRVTDGTTSRFAGQVGASGTLTVASSSTVSGGGGGGSGGSGGGSTVSGGGGPVGTPTVTGGGFLPFAYLVASSPTAGATITVAAQVLGGVSGTYSNLGSGTVSADGVTYTVSGTAAAVTSALASVVFTPSSGTVTSVQAAISGAAADALTDTSGNGDVLVGLSGTNSVIAGGGAETLFGATGSSTLYGGAGADVMAATTGSNVLVGGSGAATMFGGTGASTLMGGSGATTMVGGVATTTMVGSTGPSAMFDGFGSISVVGGSAAATIVGTFGADTISVSANANLIGVGGGNAVLTSNGQADTLIGGAGQDNVQMNGASLMFGGAGSLALSTGAGAATLVGGAGSETVNIGSGGGLFYGGFSGTSVLNASAGNVTMTGLADGTVLTTAGSGPALLVGGLGTETLSAAASSGNVTLIGGGPDLYALGSGSDVVSGGPGGGTINAGAGADLLFFVSGTSGGSFTINGFKVGTDHVSFQGYGASSAALGAQLLASGSTGNGSTTLTLPDQTRITFAGVTNLTSSSFV